MKKISLKRKNPQNPQIINYCRAIQKTRNSLAHSQQVIPNQKGGWTVRKTGSVKGQNFSNKTEAISRAKKIAKNNGRDLFIHYKNGALQERISY